MYAKASKINTRAYTHHLKPSVNVHLTNVVKYLLAYRQHIHIISPILQKQDFLCLPKYNPEKYIRFEIWFIVSSRDRAGATARGMYIFASKCLHLYVTGQRRLPF